MTARLVMVVCALLVGVLPVRAANSVGTAPAAFLNVGAAASSAGMAGATLALGDGLAAAAWNPAALAAVDRTGFAIAHAPSPAGASHDWLATGGRSAGAMRWGLQAVVQRESGIEGRDLVGNPTGDLSVSDLALALRVAHPIGRAIGVGVGAEWVTESLAGVNGSGLAFEAGLRARSGPFGVAVAARHIGGGIRYGGTRYDLPAVVAAGLAWDDAARGARVALDLESPSHGRRSVRAGGEWRWRDRLAVRAGWRQMLESSSEDALTGASFGLGVAAGPAWLDYAFTPDGDEAAGAHRIGLAFRGSSREPRASESSPAREPAVAAVVRTESPRPAVMTKRVPLPTAPPVARTMPVPTVPTVPAVVPAAVPVPIAAEDLVVLPEAATASTGGFQRAVSVARAPLAVSSRAVVPVVPRPVPLLVEPEPVIPVAPVVAEPKPVASAVAEPASRPVAVVVPPTVVVTSPEPRPTLVVVGDGETLAAIAARWSVSVAAIMMENDLVNAHVQKGQRLRLPPASRR